MLTVDESREQTRAILASQRKRQTLEAMAGNASAESVIVRHRNFQRLLQPVVVINPHAEDLAYRDDRLQSRRDHPKYLNLIKAVAFIRQMTKDKKVRTKGQKEFSYIEADREDIRIADELAAEILHRNLEDLNGVSQALLAQIERLVEARLKQMQKDGIGKTPDRSDILFTRREIREFTGWSHNRVKRYMKQLVDLEFVAAESGRFGIAYRYRLLCEPPANGPVEPGQPGRTWPVPGHPDLEPQPTDSEQVRCKPGQN